MRRSLRSFSPLFASVCCAASMLITMAVGQAPKSETFTIGAGDRVNIEVDLIARYVGRLLGE